MEAVGAAYFLPQGRLVDFTAQTRPSQCIVASTDARHDRSNSSFCFDGLRVLGVLACPRVVPEFESTFSFRASRPMYSMQLQNASKRN
jgi:hypothetical protein